LHEARPAVSSDLAVFAKRMEDVDFKEVIDAFCKSNFEYLKSLVSDISTNTDLFLFTIDHSIRPFLRIFARPYQENLRDFEFYWDIPSICPVCGAKSHMCHLSSDEGQRFMFCDRCFSEWIVRYLACVYCGHDRPGEINIFKLADDPAYQIYVCEKCKGYIKTYDKRDNEGRSVDLYITNIETIYLDMLAQEKGYTNHDEE
jgi:FdhE protein